ncbi:MAG: hypothetical protein IJI07_04975 [Flexilinea sp.]|nr:hypothetical protein [Flexilinea sp.]
METEMIQKIYCRLIENAGGKPGPAILAIDGRCASGKTTLGNQLAAEWNASLFHMDDFYLQPHQRTEERLAEPGGNVDRERFLEEVLLPLREGKPVSYRRFDCGTFTFEPARLIETAEIAIVEGSYALHPQLRDLYDLRIFMDIDPEEQMRRILKRNGPEVAERFRTRWIPLEEAYFEGCSVRKAADLIITGK